MSVILVYAYHHYISRMHFQSCSFFVKKKSQLASKIEDLLTKLKTAKYTTKYIRCDNVGENVSCLTKLCEKSIFKLNLRYPTHSNRMKLLRKSL